MILDKFCETCLLKVYQAISNKKCVKTMLENCSAKNILFSQITQ